MKKLVWLFALSFLWAMPVSAKVLPDYLSQGVAEVSAYSGFPFDEENRLLSGSGTFVDNGGCLYTNSHVVLNLQDDEVWPFIVVKTSTNRSKKAEFTFEAEVLYVDQGLDLAYLCPIGDFTGYTHFFPRLKKNQFEKRAFGESVYIIGYTGAGEGTVTMSSGDIVGFIDSPDTQKWFGVPEFDESQLKIYKTDALAGPGISGGAMINDDYELIAVPFAGTLTPGGFVFGLSEDVYLEFDRRTRRALYEQELVPLDCVYDFDSDYYYQAGQAFYDNQCKFSHDENMEIEIARSWQAFCGSEIRRDVLVPAIRRSKQLGDLSAFYDDLGQICPPSSVEASDGRQESETQSDAPTTAGDFAYGKARLASLETEQALARELKGIIDAEFPGLQISEENWSTVVNSYVYGNYPVEAIEKAIEYGGKTVHPTIPWESWKGSPDYLSVM